MPLQAQVIRHVDRPVAIVLGAGHAVVTGDVSGDDLAVVQGMCIYALEIASGERPDPYRDEDAERFAQGVTKRERQGARAQARRGCGR